MRFNNGDIVRISRKSRYYKRNTDSNPKDIEGEIESLDMDIDNSIWVKWETGQGNCYTENDLRLVRKV